MPNDNIDHGGPLDTNSSDQTAILNADRHSPSCTDHNFMWSTYGVWSEGKK